MKNFRIICPPASDDAASGAGEQETSGCTLRAGVQPSVAARGRGNKTPPPFNTLYHRIAPSVLSAIRSARRKINSTNITPSMFCHNSPQKCLRNFPRGDIMRELWGRGSGGRAMRSQRIGQGFESPRLHQKTARISCLCSFLLSRGDSAAHSLRRPALRAEPLLPVRADALLRPTRLRAQIKWRKTAIPSLRSLRVPSSPPKNAAKIQCLCRVFFRGAG